MTDGIKIEKGVPMPKRRTKWDFADKMEVGDSFLMPGPASYQSTVKSRLERKTGYSFTTRVTDEGIRVWRIK